MKEVAGENVRVRLYAAARARVGLNDIYCKAGSAKEILETIANGDFSTLALFSRCSILIDGEQLHDRNSIIRAGSEMDILPPFAGGAA